MINRCGILASAFLFLLITTISCEAEPKRVLLLHSFGREFAPWNEFARYIRGELAAQSTGRVDLYEAELSTARLGDQGETAFADYLEALFTNHRLDLVVSLGAPAAHFFQRHRQRLFPATPILMTAVEQRRVPLANLTANDTVVPISIDLRGVVETILHVRPETTNIAVVIGDSPLERYWLEQIRNDVKPLTGRVAFTWFNRLSLDEMVKRVGTLPPHSAIFFALLTVDAAGVSHEEGKAVADLSAAANAPMFSHHDAYFGRGILGGPLISAEEVSRQAVSVAVRILRGERAGDIKTPPIGAASLMFDWREMQRWNISEESLPPGSKIRFREPGAWEQYRPYVFGFAALILLQAALIMWLLYEHRRRQRAEILTRSTMSELAHLNRIATAGELSASIAHEVNQPLTGIVTRANAALRWLAAETPDIEKARSALSQIVSAGHRASDIIASVRAMFKREADHRTAVDVNKLILAVLALVDVELRRHHVQVQTQLGDRPTVTGNPIQLQQVVLNLVMNAIEAMHSAQPGSRVLRVQSQLTKSNEVHVSIEDSGPGIAPSDRERIFKPLFTTKLRGMGMGLSICHSIIEGHDGRLWVSAAQGSGSIFQFILPASGQESLLPVGRNQTLCS
jgi:signal transduction histidine kinase